MKSTRYKATVALGVAIAGFLTSYPFSSNLYGGMINSGCWAAMIGGLADWFTVTALFKKPLGFPYRTAIIPKNRDRIFNDLSDFINKNLLNKVNVLKTFDQYKVAELFIRYMEEQGGKVSTKEIAQEIIQDILGQLDAHDMGQLVETFIRQHASQVKAFPLIVQAIDWTIKEGYDEKLINFLLDETMRIMGHSTARLMLSNLFDGAKQIYERDMIRRQFMDWLMNISSDQLAGIAQDKLIGFLGDLKNPAHPLRNELKAWVTDLICQLKTNQEFQETVEFWKNKVIKKKLNIKPQIEQHIKAWQEVAATYTGEQDHWLHNVDREIDKLVDHFKASEQLQQRLDCWVKNKVTLFIDKYLSCVADIVKARLGEFTDVRLAEFIEAKVGDNLQMIRINGSVIGGLVGIILYLLTLWVERIG